MTYTEYGIQAPNGQFHWGNFIGRPLGTEAERATLSLVLHKTAQELNWPEDEFVEHFKWVTRTISEPRASYCIDDPKIAPPLVQPGQPAPEQVVSNPSPVKATRKSSTRRRTSGE